jgi:hypothetical protein
MKVTNVSVMQTSQVTGIRISRQMMNRQHDLVGYIIRYVGCPLIWGSKLQKEIALSSTESEYIALS